MSKILQRYVYIGTFVVVLNVFSLLLAVIVFPNVLSLILIGVSFTVSSATLQLLLWSNLRWHIDILSRQINSVQAQGSLQSIPLQTPAFLLTHSVAPDVLMLMGEFIRRFPIRQVLELGSGTSSLYLAKMLECFKGSGSLVSLEDSEAWKNLVQKELNTTLSNKDVSARVIHAPLSSVSFQQTESVMFYSLPEEVLQEQNNFDMVFIDGPSIIPHRIFALNLLMPYLAKDCIVVWDDSEHAAIQAAVRSFISKNPDWSSKYYNTVKGTWVIYRLANHNLPLP